MHVCMLVHTYECMTVRVECRVNHSSREDMMD